MEAFKAPAWSHEHKDLPWSIGSMHLGHTCMQELRLGCWRLGSHCQPRNVDVQCCSHRGFSLLLEWQCLQMVRVSGVFIQHTVQLHLWLAQSSSDKSCLYSSNRTDSSNFVVHVYTSTAKPEDCIAGTQLWSAGGYREFKTTLFGMMPMRVVTRLPPKWTASFRATQRTDLPMHALPSLPRSLSGKVATG